MATNCLFNLQKAVFSVLDGDSSISNTVEGVFTHVPQNTVFPYVHVHTVSSQDQSTIETTILEVVLEVQSYSRTRGTEEVSGIMSDIKRLLHHQSLTVSGCVCLGIRLLDDQFEELTDGLTWRGTQRFQVWLHVSS